MEENEKKELALQIIDRLKKAYPDADCTLDYDDAWKLLVSVRLAAQCTDARVNVVVEGLYKKYPDSLKLVHLLPFSSYMTKMHSCQNKLMHLRSRGHPPTEVHLLLARLPEELLVPL